MLTINSVSCDLCKVKSVEPSVELLYKSCDVIVNTTGDKLLLGIGTLLMLIVSPTENEVARVMSGGDPTFVFLVTRILAGRETVGAVVNPVPNLLTSTPLTDPILFWDQGKNVAPVPCAVY